MKYSDEEIRRQLQEWYDGRLTGESERELLAALREAEELPDDLLAERDFLAAMMPQEDEIVEVPAGLEEKLRLQTSRLARQERSLSARTRNLRMWGAAAVAGVLLGAAGLLAWTDFSGESIDLSELQAHQGKVMPTGNAGDSARTGRSLASIPTAKQTVSKQTPEATTAPSRVIKASELKRDAPARAKAGTAESRHGCRGISSADMATLREGFANVSEGLTMASSSCSSDFEYNSEAAQSAVTNVALDMQMATVGAYDSYNKEKIVAL